MSLRAGTVARLGLKEAGGKIRLEHRGYSFCRYADDRSIFVRMMDVGQREMKSLTRFLEYKLHLGLTKGISAPGPAEERKFPGYRLLHNGFSQVF